MWLNWISFFPTITGDRTFFDYIENKSGDLAALGRHENHRLHVRTMFRQYRAVYGHNGTQV